jgi:dihydropteroate synthase
MIFQARQYKFTFPRPALVMGVVNVTPDSFSDGGRFFKPAAAIVHALELVREGADILDIGGESTRPGAKPVSEKEELRRVIPVIEALARRVPVPLSIDTTKPAVARAALGAGASIINDVAANRARNGLWRLAAETGAGYIAMHMQGTPRTMQKKPAYTNVVAEVRRFFVDRLKLLAAAGVEREQIVLDVGIGFGKNLSHNLQLLGGLGSFTSLGRPLLLGVSRKSFIGQLSGGEETDRLTGGLACSVLAREAGVVMFRSHDVAATVQALRVAEAVLARRKR